MAAESGDLMEKCVALASLLATKGGQFYISVNIGDFNFTVKHGRNKNSSEKKLSVHDV